MTCVEPEYIVSFKDCCDIKATMPEIAKRILSRPYDTVMEQFDCTHCCDDCTECNKPISPDEDNLIGTNLEDNGISLDGERALGKAYWEGYAKGKAEASIVENKRVLEELKRDLKTRFIPSNNQWSKGRNSGLIECCNIIDESLRNSTSIKEGDE